MVNGGSAKVGRRVRSTALIYCEGAHDLAFVRHTIGLYKQAGLTIARFRSKQGKGGSPDSLLIEALNIPGDFNRKLVKADKDRPLNEIKRAEQLSSKNAVIIIWSKPCIEALLLSILDGKDYSGYKSKACKQDFETNCIPHSKRANRQAYARLFTLKKLEEARKRIPELDQLISFITS